MKNLYLIYNYELEERVWYILLTESYLVSEFTFSILIFCFLLESSFVPLFKSVSVNYHQRIYSMVSIFVVSFLSILLDVILIVKNTKLTMVIFSLFISLL